MITEKKKKDLIALYPEEENKVFCLDCMHRNNLLCENDIMFINSSRERIYVYIPCEKKNRKNNCMEFEVEGEVE